MLFLLLPGVLILGGDGHEERDSWRELDRAVAALQSSDDTSPFSWGVLLRTFFTGSPKEATAAGTADVSGNVIEDLDLHFGYHDADVAWRVSADFEGGNAELEDAYARWRTCQELTLTVGQFKPRVTRSGSLPDDALLFRERTFLGAAFDGWDDGFELSGHYDQFDYWFDVMDSSNGEQSNHLWTMRGEWALFDAAWDDLEGARGAPNHLRTLLGVYSFHDDALSTHNGDGWGTDLALTFGPYSFHGEWADLDDEFARTIDVFNGYLITLGDGQPRAFTLGRRVGEGGEGALRFQKADDADHTQSFGLAADWSPHGGVARWVADVGWVQGDTRDFTIFSIGLQLGSSGQARPFLGEY
ncbi:MAG: hypothetical protein EXS08_00965 [Planctomycetes bacterium]|nr:hypothetical protein [Planctomycetota bacterium]